MENSQLCDASGAYEPQCQNTGNWTQARCAHRIPGDGLHSTPFPVWQLLGETLLQGASGNRESGGNLKAGRSLGLTVCRNRVYKANLPLRSVGS